MLHRCFSICYVEINKDPLECMRFRLFLFEDEGNFFTRAYHSSIMQRNENALKMDAFN